MGYKKGLSVGGQLAGPRNPEEIAFHVGPSWGFFVCFFHLVICKLFSGKPVANLML